MKSQLQAVPPGELAQRDDVVLGHAAHGDGVDLHRIETGLLGRQDPLDHLLEAGAARQTLELGGVHRVQADVDPLQPGVAQGSAPSVPAGCRWSSGRCR